MDTLFATRKYTKSTKGITCCQLFVIDNYFLQEETLRNRDDLIHALNSFTKEVGVPGAIIADGAPEENSAEVKKLRS